MHLREPDTDDPRGSLHWEDGCRPIVISLSLSLYIHMHIHIYIHLYIYIYIYIISNAPAGTRC